MLYFWNSKFSGSYNFKNFYKSVYSINKKYNLYLINLSYYYSEKVIKFVLFF